MKELTQYVLVLLLGASVMIFAISHYEISKSAQKIENIKVLYELKANLYNKKFNEDTDRWIKETQKKIDSLENIE